MVDAARSKNRTILIVDDNEDVHQDFRKILITEPESDELDELEASIFGPSDVQKPLQSFDLSSAYQGAEALDKVRSAHRAGRPYALAFVDVRMPPGWDGVETLTRLWEEDSSLQAVICSAYSDYAWDHIARRFGTTDNLLVLRKPFDPAEVLQMASTMTEKWNQHAAGLLAHLRLTVQKSILEALIKASSLDQGASEMLRIVGAELGLQLGALWTLHPASGELHVSVRVVQSSDRATDPGRGAARDQLSGRLGPPGRARRRRHLDRRARRRGLRCPRRARGERRPAQRPAHAAARSRRHRGPARALCPRRRREPGNPGRAGPDQRQHRPVRQEAADRALKPGRRRGGHGLLAARRLCCVQPSRCSDCRVWLE